MIGETYLDGKHVFGMYLGEFACSGIVEISRVRYGGGMSHHVVLDNPITVYGAVRERVILEADKILGVI